MVQPAGTRVLIDASGRPRVQRVRVTARRGPNKGLDLTLDAEPIRIGTSEGCEVQLTDSAVSGLHVELSRTAYGLCIRDLGSTNGTYVEGRRVQAIYAKEPVDVQVGETQLRIRPLSENSTVEIAAVDRFGDMVGVSMAMRAVFAKLERLANTNVTVLVTGETGTGKELVAGALREMGDRRDKPLVVVDCGAMPHNLIESELFGHERGAFTGAESARAGAFERAHTGTIFLDEIGELPLSLQPALLGVLERREVRRVGGQKTIPIDVRVVAATNRDLASEVQRGAFRADLFYRLAVVEVKLPPLRERPDDIPLLVDHFLDQFATARPVMGRETIEQLKAYPWPGNIRELRNVIERAALLAEAPQVSPGEGAATKHMEASLSSGATPDAHDAAGGAPLRVRVDEPFKDQKNALIAQFEQAYLEALLENTQGNIAAAARKARIDRMYLYKLIDRYQIDIPKR